MFGLPGFGPRHTVTYANAITIQLHKDSRGETGITARETAFGDASPCVVSRIEIGSPADVAGVFALYIHVYVLCELCAFCACIVCTYG